MATWAQTKSDHEAAETKFHEWVEENFDSQDASTQADIQQYVCMKAGVYIQICENMGGEPIQ